MLFISVQFVISLCEKTCQPYFQKVQGSLDRRKQYPFTGTKIQLHGTLVTYVGEYPLICRVEIGDSTELKSNMYVALHCSFSSYVC